MQLSDDDVIRCLEKAKELSEAYELYVRAPDACARSMDDMLWVVGQYLQKAVEVNDLDVLADDKVIRGMFAAFEDGHYEIFLLGELNERERRVVTTKEVCHVLLDEEDCRSMDIYDHVQEAASSFSIENDTKPESPVATEFLAEIAAMEFLLPYAKRKEILAHANGDPDYAMVARVYGIPQVYVERYLSDRLMAEFTNIMEKRWPIA